MQHSLLGLIPVAALAVSLVFDHLSSLKWEELRRRGAPLREVGFAASFVRDPETGGYSGWRGLLWGSLLIAGLAAGSFFGYRYHDAAGLPFSLAALIGLALDILTVRRNYRMIEQYKDRFSVG